MTKITRRGTETLAIANCPCCGGDVDVGDCGYSSFNPGWAKCLGECKRKWNLGYVEDQWSAGKCWNKKASWIEERLSCFSLLCVRSVLSSSRDYNREQMEHDANRLLNELKEYIIGSDGKGGE